MSLVRWIAACGPGRGRIETLVAAEAERGGQEQHHGDMRGLHFSDYPGAARFSQPPGFVQAAVFTINGGSG